MPIFAPRLINGATTIQGWFLFHWLDITPLGLVLISEKGTFHTEIGKITKIFQLAGTDNG